MQPLLILGAGGHGRVLADALLTSGREIRAFVERDTNLIGTQIRGIEVVPEGPILEQALREGWPLANGLGGVGGSGEGVGLRRRVQDRLEAAGHQFSSVIHPTAIVSADCALAADVQVLAGAVIQPGVVTGRGVIVNTRAVVEHDCRLSDFVHCAPGSVVCGDACLGENTHVGAGAVVRQGVRVGANITIGVGAAVVSDHSSPGYLLGVPAKLRNLE